MLTLIRAHYILPARQQEVVANAENKFRGVMEYLKTGRLYSRCRKYF